MDNHELLTSIFAEHIELTANCASDITHSLAQAGEEIASSLITDNKLLCAGQNNQNTMAQLLCSYLVNGHDQERPSLPAIHLSASNFSNNSLSYRDCFSKQITALGQAGDILFLFSDSTIDESAIAAIHTARDLRLNIIACTNCEDLTKELQEQDTLIELPPASKVHSLELQLAVVHCLCAVIDNQIFGGI